MPTDKQALVGTWDKVTSSSCSGIYPDRLVFQGDGRYRGQKQAAGTFAIWDVGTFDVVSDAQVKISTANDAVRVYSFALAGDLLTFVDPEQCEFRYRRAA